MASYPPRSASSSSELSWPLVVALIAGGVVALVGLVGLFYLLGKQPAIRSAEGAGKPGSNVIQHRGSQPPESREALEREVARLKRQVRKLEAKQDEPIVFHPTPDYRSPSSAPKSAEERMVAAMREVQVSSGPFVKSSTGMAQISFTLTNTGNSRITVPVKVRLFRDGNEVGSKSALATIGARQSLAYSVVVPSAGAGTGGYSASVDIDVP